MKTRLPLSSRARSVDVNPVDVGLVDVTSGKAPRAPRRGARRLFPTAGLALALLSSSLDAGASAAEPKGPPQRVGVLRLGFRGSIPGEIRRQFLQKIVDGLSSPSFQVFPVLEDEPASCATASCLAEAAKRLRVDYLVSGQVEEHAKTYAVTLRLIQGPKGEDIGVHRDTCETCGAEEAAEKIGLAAAALRNRLATMGEQPSRFIVRSQPSGAELSLDGKPAGHTPLDLDLAPGEHQVRLQARGFEPIARTFNAVAGIDETISLELVPRPTRFPLKAMGYGSVAAGLVAFVAGAWAVHVNEHPISCSQAEKDMNGTCPRQWSTATTGALLMGAGAALGTLGGTWLYLSRSGGAQDEGPTTQAGTAYFVGLAGRL